MVQRLKCFFLSAWLLWASPLAWVVIDATSSTSSSSTIPRSQHRPSAPTDVTRFPPWNPSPNIDANGFLKRNYDRIPGEWEKEVKLKRRHQTSLKTPSNIRQVPGDGNCLFHSISTCLSHAVNGTHLDLRNSHVDLHWLYQNSAKLRAQAVDCLEQPRKLLFLQGHEHLKAHDLVEAAASQYDINGPEYCRLMRQDSYWGGGPEIVALSNVLQRPIHVYELHAQADRFVLRRMACFGSPKFDRESALHILSADSRFPDLNPGKQLPSGNHFLAMFPCPIDDSMKPKRKRQRLRGGDDHLLGAEIEDLEDEDEAVPPRGFLPTHWFSRLWMPQT